MSYKTIMCRGNSVNDFWTLHHSNVLPCCLVFDETPSSRHLVLVISCDFFESPNSTLKRRCVFKICSKQKKHVEDISRNARVMFSRVQKMTTAVYFFLDGTKGITLLVFDFRL